MDQTRVLGVPTLQLPAVMALNVRAGPFNAVGDGVADDTAALKAALRAARTVAQGADTVTGQLVGAIVFLPPGVYGVSEDIDIPEGVDLCGAGAVATRIKWIGVGAPADAVVVSNVATQYGYVFGSKLRNVMVDANGQNRGVHLVGWNENCVVECLNIENPAVEGFVCTQGSGGQQNEHTAWRNIRVAKPAAAGCKGLYLENTRRINFQSVTVDGGGGVGGVGFLYGIEIATGSHQVKIQEPNLEDCDVGIIFSGFNPCCIVENPVFQNPSVVPATLTFGAFTGTHCLVSSGTTQDYIVLGARDFSGHTYIVTDTFHSKAYLGVGDGATTKNLAWLFVSGGGTTNIVWWEPSGGALWARHYATANLPAAATAMNGAILIEDDAVNGRNLVYYVNAARYRVVGVAF